MNPVKERLELLLNTRYRASGSTTKPVFKVPFSIPEMNKFAIKNIYMPYSFFDIAAGDRDTNLFIFRDSLAVEITLGLDTGNYNNLSLAEHLETEMNNNTTDGLTYFVTVDEIKNKMTITNSGPTNFELRFNASNEIAKLLGYTTAESVNQFHPDQVVNLTGASSYTANYPMRLRTRTINIHSNLVAESDMFVKSVDRKQGISDIKGADILYQFQNDKLVDEIFNYSPNTYNWIKLRKGTQLSDISFKITDNDLRLIDFNGRPWQINLVFSK